jgi:K+ transporter
MFTIDEVKKRRMERKRKWGSSLILFLKDKLDENLPIEAIVEYLKETHNFQLTAGDLYQLKSKYYIPSMRTHTIKEESLVHESKQIHSQSVEQIPNLSDAQKMYNSIYKNVNKKIAFDLGTDF